MRRQRATRTDRLLNIIGVIELGRRTGLLSIERDEPFTTEEGDLYFLAGEAIYASTSTESGRAALNTMRSWGACRFAFLADIPRPVPNIGPEVRGVRPQQTGALRLPTSGPMPSAQPSQRSGPLDPPAQRSGPLARTPSGQIISSPPAFPPSNAPRQVSKQQMEQYPSRITGSFQSPPAVPPVTPPPSFPAPSQPLPIARSHRPRRAPNPQDIPRLAATYHLSWAHRTLLLLADGEHTIVDLARLARRSEEEVVTLLADLIRLGLVSLL